MDDLKKTGDKKEPETLIELYELQYLEALNRIDKDVKELVKAGKEMQALCVCHENILILQNIHSQLHNMYDIIYGSQEILKTYKSRRLEQLGYKLQYTRKIYETKQLGSMYFASETVLENLTKIGVKPKKNKLLDPVFLAEIEYMLKTLKVLVEPEFIPLEMDSKVEEEKASRHIPSKVKMSVWRRDQGQCVECGSKEKLEYDHIIPVSKGGNNTERNIQLLCEKCNRQKSANIQ